ncbi:MAG: MBL fold metallo-hydrolase [Provencibacterium sp.]|jgi:glyoxylase-like metal-dependent hydrolase (beta-lactamase superfamily II)|nr:MBL fold metallo-hydrolase [Provencibacterium sp.]
MFELYPVGERSYYLDSPAKIGIYRATDSEVYFIDSGSDKDAGRRARKKLEENGWRLRGILNTHSNADHIGGNQYLQRQTGCKIFAGGIEAAFTRYPVLEPSFLYGGYPCKELRHKFLLAAESEVSDFSDGSFPKEIEIIPLGGHFFDMVGFRTPDDVVYLADCLSSRETLEKHPIGFIYDVAAYLDTLERVKALQAKMFVPAHAAATEEIAPLAEYNINKVSEIAERILELCKEPLCIETLLQKLFAHYGMQMNFEQYVLVGSTVRSYLAWLKDTGRLEARFENNWLLWERV